MFCVFCCHFHYGSLMFGDSCRRHYNASTIKEKSWLFFYLVFNILTKLGWILILAFIIYALKTLCKLVGEVSSEVPIDYIVNVTDQLKNIQLKNIQS